MHITEERMTTWHNSVDYSYKKEDNHRRTAKIGKGTAGMTIDTSDSRTVKALAALPTAGQWLKVRDRDGRALAYGVPSATRPGVYHFATVQECTCEDHRRGHHCWHSRAVAMHMASLKVPRPNLTDPTRAAKHRSVRNLTVSSRAAQQESVTSATPAAYEADERFWRRFAD